MVKLIHAHPINAYPGSRRLPSRLFLSTIAVVATAESAKAENIPSERAARALNFHFSIFENIKMISRTDLLLAEWMDRLSPGSSSSKAELARPGGIIGY